MDQSKWALPRNRLVQSSKETQNLIRPRVKIHAVWLHGVSLNLYVVHPGVPADSSLVAECLLRSLEDAVCLFKKYQKPFPRELFVFVPRLNHPDSVSNLVTQCSVRKPRWFDFIPGEADNTVRENKNNCQMKLMCALLQKQLLRVCSMLYPRVGHSHGSLGNFDCTTVLKNVQNIEFSHHLLVTSIISILSIWICHTKINCLEYYLNAWSTSTWCVILWTWSRYLTLQLLWKIWHWFKTRQTLPCYSTLLVVQPSFT